jgi:hypothetical protein
MCGEIVTGQVQCVEEGQPIENGTGGADVIAW